MNLKKYLIDSYQLNTKFLKFLIVGIVNTIFGYLLFSLLIFLGIDYKLSLLISYIVGILFNFFSYGFLAFSYSFTKASFIKFILTYIFIYNLNVITLENLNILIQNLYLSQLASIPFMVFLTWLILNKWVFR